MLDAEVRSIKQLVADLGSEVSSLVRNEIELAKLELKQNVKRASSHLMLIAAGGVIAFTAFLALTATVIALLAIALPLWLAALLTTVVWAAAGGVLIASGLKALKQTDMTLRHTIRTVREDLAWAKVHIR